MPERVRAPHVGAPDPEKRNSEVVEETDYDFELKGQTVPETPMCYFNDAVYRDNAYVCSGDELLKCMGGVWVRAGTCDPDNPP